MRLYMVDDMAQDKYSRKLSDKLRELMLKWQSYHFKRRVYMCHSACLFIHSFISGTLIKIYLYSDKFANL